MQKNNWNQNKAVWFVYFDCAVLLYGVVKDDLSKTFIWNWETYCNTCIIRRLKLEIPRLWTTIYFKLSSSRKSNIKVVKINFKVGKSNFKVGKSNFKVENSEIKVCVSNFKDEKIYFKVGNSNFQVGIFKEKNFNIALIRFHRIPFKYVFFFKFRK